jgi:hypothetical protein
MLTQSPQTPPMTTTDVLPDGRRRDTNGPDHLARTPTTRDITSRYTPFFLPNLLHPLIHNHLNKPTTSYGKPSSPEIEWMVVLPLIRGKMYGGRGKSGLTHPCPIPELQDLIILTTTTANITTTKIFYAHFAGPNGSAMR